MGLHRVQKEGDECRGSEGRGQSVLKRSYCRVSPYRGWNDCVLELVLHFDFVSFSHSKQLVRDKFLFVPQFSHINSC